MQLTLEGNARNVVIDPRDRAEGRVDAIDLHRHPVAQRGKAAATADLAPAFGDIEQFYEDHARTDMALDREFHRSAFGRSGNLELHGAILAPLAKK